MTQSGPGAWWRRPLLYLILAVCQSYGHNEYYKELEWPKHFERMFDSVFNDGPKWSNFPMAQWPSGFSSPNRVMDIYWIFWNFKIPKFKFRCLIKKKSVPVWSINIYKYPNLISLHAIYILFIFFYGWSWVSEAQQTCPHRDSRLLWLWMQMQIYLHIHKRSICAACRISMGKWTYKFLHFYQKKKK